MYIHILIFIFLIIISGRNSVLIDNVTIHILKVSMGPCQRAFNSSRAGVCVTAVAAVLDGMVGA